MTHYVKFAVLSISIVLSLCIGCKGGYSGFKLVFSRGAQLNIITAADEYRANDEIGFGVHVSQGEQDQRMLPTDYVSKVEVDPGDGSVWLDFTQGYIANTSLLTADGTHVYGEPGEYTVRTRVTYWDGEVLVDPGGQRTITVLPAEE